MNICLLPLITTILQLIFGAVFAMLFPFFGENIYLTMLQLFLTTVLSIGIPCYIYLKMNKKPFFSDCFEDVRPGSMIAFSFFLGIFGQFAGIFANLPIDLLYLRFGQDISDNLPQIKTFGHFISGIAVMCITPAVLEEIFFRGIIFNHFRRYGSTAAIIISAMIFAIVHYNALNLFGPFVLGVIFGLLMKYTHRIIYPMIAHFTVNFTGLLMTYANNFEPWSEYYPAVMLAAMVVSLPVISHMMKQIKDSAKPLPYYDLHESEKASENILETASGDTVKIIEYSDNNQLKKAFHYVFSSPYIYIMMVIFAALTLTEFI